MTEETLGAVAAILRNLPAPGVPPWDQDTTNLYWLALRELPDEDVIAAVTEGLRTWEFRPVPARIVEMVAKQMGIGDSGESPSQFIARKQRQRQWLEENPETRAALERAEQAALGPPDREASRRGIELINNLAGRWNMGKSLAPPAEVENDPVLTGERSRG